ncbi:hypothetical protein ES703_57817 [subsurface metagenome]
MKSYTKPTVVKVELNHEQAVLGACQVGAGTLEDADPSGKCRIQKNCKQDNTGDSAATS